MKRKGGPQGFKSVPSREVEKKEQHDDDDDKTKGKTGEKGRPQRHFSFPQRAPPEEGDPAIRKDNAVFELSNMESIVGTF